MGEVLDQLKARSALWISKISQPERTAMKIKIGAFSLMLVAFLFSTPIPSCFAQQSEILLIGDSHTAGDLFDERVLIFIDHAFNRGVEIYYQ